MYSMMDSYAELLKGKCSSYDTNHWDGGWSRKLPRLGSGALLILLAGVSGSSAGRQFIRLRSMARPSI
jgi:hypothetical protein